MKEIFLVHFHYNFLLSFFVKTSIHSRYTHSSTDKLHSASSRQGQGRFWIWGTVRSAGAFESGSIQVAKSTTGHNWSDKNVWWCQALPTVPSTGSRYSVDQHKSKRWYTGHNNIDLQRPQIVCRMPTTVWYSVCEYHENLEIRTIRHEGFRSIGAEGHSATQIGNLARLCHRFVWTAFTFWCNEFFWFLLKCIKESTDCIFTYLAVDECHDGVMLCG